MKRILALVMVGLLVVGAVGCSGADKTSKGAFAEFDANKKIKLTIGNPGGDTLTPPQLLEMFKEKYPNIELTVDGSPWGDYETKLTQQLAAKNAADVFVMDSGTIASYGSKGLLMDLSSKIESDFNNEEYVALDAGKTFEGQVWGVPHAINSVALLYNKAMFDNSGIPYPEADWTWEEMFDIAKKLTVDNDGDGVTDIYGLMTSQNITQGWLPMILATGGTPLDETRTKSNFDKPEVIDGLKLYKKMMDDGIAPDAQTKAAFGGSSSVAFVNEKIAMFVAQAGELNSVEKLKADDFEYDVQYMPVGFDGKQHTIYVPNMWSVNSNASSDSAAAAWEWIKFYESEESQQIIAQTRLAGFPIKKSALESIGDLVETPANIEVFYDKLGENGVTLFENACWSTWTGVVSAGVSDIYRNTKPFDEIIETIQTDVAKALEETYGN